MFILTDAVLKQELNAIIAAKWIQRSYVILKNVLEFEFDLPSVY